MAQQVIDLAQSKEGVWEIDRARLPPFDHQLVGVSSILRHPYFFLADEMGAGKTKQTIDAAQALYAAGRIHRVIVIAPASVRSVWYHPELGELAKHLWLDMPSTVLEYHAKTRSWSWPAQEHLSKIRERVPLQWMVTNYELVRSDRHLEPLLQFCDQKTMLVLDESSAVKNIKSQQTKACLRIRQQCGRVLLINGTPISNTPGDMFAQSWMMHPSILGCKTFFHFRSRYAKMGGYMGKSIVGWHDLDDMQRRLAPYVIRRLKKDCLDLPEKLPPVTLTVALTKETWEIYKEMRDQMVAWLSDTTVVSAPQAIVKVMRLAQITSGFLGGVESLDPVLTGGAQPAPDWLLELDDRPLGNINAGPTDPVQEISREKLDLLLDWMDLRLYSDATLKFLLFSRFLPEVLRTKRELKLKFPDMVVEGMHSGQKRIEREAALQLLDPRRTVPGSGSVVATAGTGGKGHTMTASHTIVNMSFDPSLEKFLQSSDRVHRPTQVHPVSYFDIVATGPKGQKTIDHHLVAQRVQKEGLADHITSGWVRADLIAALLEE